MAFGTSASMRVIATPQKTAEFLTRLETFCREHGLFHMVNEGKVYWKFGGQQQTTVFLDDLQVWSETQWLEAFGVWFNGQIPLIEPSDEYAEFCYYAPYGDMDAYFVILQVPKAFVQPD